MPAVSTITVEILPDGDTFTPALDRIVARAADFTPVWAVIYASFLAMEAQRFVAEGPNWAGLADSTVAQRGRLGIGGAHPILDRTGASATPTSSRARKTYGNARGGRKGGTLKGSLTQPGATYAVFRPGVEQVFMGTSDPVAAYHQDGTERMPARPIVDISVEDEAMWAELVGEHLFGTGFSGAESAALIGAVGL